MRVFVPVEDDFVPEAAAGLLVPYRAGMDCWHALGHSAMPVEIDDAEVQRCTINASPAVKPSLAA